MSIGRILSDVDVLRWRMPEHSKEKEKEMDRLRHLAGVLRQAFADATAPEPGATKKVVGVKKLRASSARRPRNSTP